MGERTVQTKNQCNTPNSFHSLRQEVTEGLLYAHSHINANTTKTLEATSFIYALIELLSEKGLLTVEELDERKKMVGRRLVRQFSEKGMGVVFQNLEYDKYAFQSGVAIDCKRRLQLCRAACCRLPFALSKQDVREGVVRWNLGEPYLIDQGKDGYCNHLNRETLGCTAYENRPVPCRAFDCRGNKQIWLDFDKMIVNPEIHRPDWPRCVNTQADKEREP
jgi:Fe-S-cluster containining protein